MDQYKIEESAAGTRLDIWLAKQLGVSRSSLERRFKAGEVTVNEKPARAHYALKVGDEVLLRASVKPAAEAAASQSLDDLPEIEVVKETDEYLVINKPAAIVMHPAPAFHGLTLVDWLLRHYPKIAKVGEDPERPGIMHRLDREASGLVVIAKTQDSFDNLKEQFKKRTITKQYTALVHGSDLPDQGEINFNIERSSQGHRMAAKPVNQSGRTAVTEFTVTHRYHNYTLLQLTIKTGRTHQIRAHLSAYNHPIVGDDLYSRQKQRMLNEKFKLGRIFLVATDLAFTDLQGERQSFSIALPSELQKFLDTVK